MGVMMRTATLPLRRRAIGTLVVLGGVALVALGFFVQLTTSDPSHQVQGTTPPVAAGAPSPAPDLTHPFALPLGGGVTAASVLRHALDHRLGAGTGVVATLADGAFRGGVVAMAAGAILALLVLPAPLLRGFAGPAAGLGLFGDAVVAAVLFGEGVRLDLSRFPSAPHVDLGPGLWVLAAGFGAILVGGALAAMRPLAGVFSGLFLAVSGAACGAALAVVVGGDRIVGLARALLPH